MITEKISLTILDPKVKGLLSELENLGLIALDSSESDKIKEKYLRKLEGKNLLDLDDQDFDISL